MVVDRWREPWKKTIYDELVLWGGMREVIQDGHVR